MRPVPDWVEEARVLAQQGVSHQLVADRLGVTRNQVTHWLRRGEHNEMVRAWKQRHGYRHPKRVNGRGKPSSEPSLTLSNMPIASLETEATTMVGARVSPELADAFKALAASNGQTLSSRVRLLMAADLRDATRDQEAA
jgi:orotate phosphoribosyltransferase-like protein